MDRKIILSLSMSVDGFISDLDGGFDWISGDGDTTQNTKKQWNYTAFLKGIDVVVMGKNSYDQKFHEDFKDKIVYVATSKPIMDYDNILFAGSNQTEARHLFHRERCCGSILLQTAGELSFW